MKRALLIFAVVAAIVAAFAAGRLDGIHHVTHDAEAWLEGDEDGLSGFVILEIDGNEYKFAAF